MVAKVSSDSASKKTPEGLVGLFVVCVGTLTGGVVSGSVGDDVSGVEVVGETV